MSSRKKKSADRSVTLGPWDPPDVHGVVPPGRTLSEDRRRAPWSASGVEGVAPPGKQKTRLGASRNARRSSHEDRTKAKTTTKAGRVPKEVSESSGRADQLKSFFDRVCEFFRKHLPSDEAIDRVVQVIQQSHVPFDIIIAFAPLTVFVGQDAKRRKRHHVALERGAKAYFNLARRLDPSVRPPRGLYPQALDPLFLDVPDMALLFPREFLTNAFLHLMEVFVEGAEPHDHALVAFACELRAQFHENEGFAGRSFEKMFPWDPPSWVADCMAEE